MTDLIYVLSWFFFHSSGGIVRIYEIFRADTLESSVC